MIRNLKSNYPIAFVFLVLLTLDCSPTINVKREFKDPVQPTSFGSWQTDVKVHMKDGCLYLLDSLITFVNSDSIIGYGSYYNQYRRLIKSNHAPGIQFKIALSDVALLETNDFEGLKGKSLTMAVVGVPMSIMTVYCLINPKACFGSCPTFYSWDGEDTCLMAEGFTSSILPSFEKEDVDMLYSTRVTGNDFHLKLTNEALETHVIRYADLLVFQRSKNERVFATPEGEFYRTSKIQSPATCKADEGEILDAIRQMDHKERYGSADSENLVRREFIEMRFDSVPDGELGLIIGCRQTLLTTYLFYQSLAYLGNSAGYFFARVESGDKSLERKVYKIWDLLGGIEVFVQTANRKWTKSGQIDEMGPIATDVHLVPLPESGTKDIKIKLRLTKGLWRIDYLALGKIEKKNDALRIRPSIITSINNKNGNIISQLSDTLHPLVTLPGDAYDLRYILPTVDSELEIFLKTRGYYIEWMRENWIREESRKNATLFFNLPKSYMKLAAKDFKKTELSMETNFWNSKYVKKN
jgi:hypothetical protein